MEGVEQPGVGSKAGTTAWNLCCLRWSPPLRGTFVASVGPLRYVEPLLLQLIASAMGSLSLQLVASAMGPLLLQLIASAIEPLSLQWIASAIEPFIASVGRLCLIGPLSHQLVAFITWDLCCLSWSPPL